METNTVILSLNDYNELRDFKDKIQKEYTLNTWCSYHSHQTWVSTNDALKELAETNNLLEKTIRELKYPIKKEPSISEIKKMSVWQFLKWRNK